MKRIHAFTLVELLVVIGIIALLISILLPSLGRARAAANSIDCQSRMRQMGQAIFLYTIDSKGILPPTRYAGGAWGDWTAAIELSKILGVKDATFDKFSPVFSDIDTNPAKYPNQIRANHYNFNGRMFPDNNGLQDPFVPGVFQLLSMTKVKNAAEKVAIWDGTCLDSSVTGGNAFPNCMGILGADGSWAWWASRGLTVLDWYPLEIKVALAPTAVGHVDFRHLGKTSTNLLFLDGHVEARKIGEVKMMEFCFPWR